MSNKIFKKREIFDEISYQEPFRWKHIKHLVLEDEDEIVSGWDEGFYTENNSMDGHFYIKIIRKVLETDEQFEKRIKREQEDAVERKERRRDAYLKLKKEFENEPDTTY